MERRKRNSVNGVRTSILLQADALKLIKGANINLSQWVEERIFKEFGGVDQVSLKLKARVSELQFKRADLDAEIRGLIGVLNSRKELKKEMGE